MLEDLARLGNISRLRNPRAQVERLLARDGLREQTLALYAAVETSRGRRPLNLKRLMERAAARPPLLSGRRLLELGIPAGRGVGAILQEVRDATLSGRVRTRRGAEGLALAIHADAGRNRAGSALQ